MQGNANCRIGMPVRWRNPTNAMATAHGAMRP
jgi:hypothetical protein